MLAKIASQLLTKLDNKWLLPIIDPRKIGQGIKGYRQYWDDWNVYAAIAGSETLRLADAYPCLYDRSLATPFDRHYFYQDTWAFKAISALGAKRHVDVGSRVIFVGMLAAIAQVSFVDIRPIRVNLDNFQSESASILALPFADNSVNSLSCLHVAEHIGLGRYGDLLDPGGTRKATQELARVLAPDGNLFFSLPVGRSRVCFNAHRIHAPNQILQYFHDLRLVDFSAVTDGGQYVPGINPGDVADASYACGMFHFTKD